MAHTQTMSPQAMYRDVHIIGSPSHRPRAASKQRFLIDLSQCLFDFVIQLLPTQEEMAVKEDVRKLLERLIRTIEPDSRLLSFGSTANGFSLRNSDMDLCCLIDSDERLAASDLVTMLGDLLERETKFHVKPLPHARIPIVKLSLDPSPGLPLGIACDIGFENRLALENTRLLMCYAMIDPTRVRTMVLFLKVWSKRRKINSPYKGTLSSYGYVLLVIYFLVHVKNPPVLPNLQQMPPLRPIPKEETQIGGYNVWFFDDIELLRQRWQSDNNETVAELLIDFFRYYSRDFLYNTGVASIRAGLLKKSSKGWQNDLTPGRYNDARERNRLCIEDPFELDFNVSRCVTRDGLYTIRGEFMRALRILIARPERAILALAELCEERKDEELVSAPAFSAPRLSTLPPQTPYTVGSQSMRPKGAPAAERFSPPTKFEENGPRNAAQRVADRPPPEHMAPRRGKWTSPPPPEAPSADQILFENQLDMGLELATAPTEAREREDIYTSSSSNSEMLSDEDRSDVGSVRSVQSFTEGASSSNTGSFRRPPSWLMQSPIIRYPQPPAVDLSTEAPSTTIPGPRGRHRPEKPYISPPSSSRIPIEPFPSSKSDFSRRSASGPSRPVKGLSLSANTPIAVTIPLPPSPESPLECQSTEPSTVYYQTSARSPRPTVLYPSPGSQSPLFSQYQTQHKYFMNPLPHDIFPSNQPPLMTSLRGGIPSGLVGDTSGRSSAGPNSPTPTPHSNSLHSHSHSTATITALTPPPHTPNFPPSNATNGSPTISSPSNNRDSLHSRSPSPSRPSLDSSPVRRHASENVAYADDTMSPQASISTSNSSSPAPSSTGYATSVSRSPSPPTTILSALSLQKDQDLAQPLKPPTIADVLAAGPIPSLASEDAADLGLDVKPTQPEILEDR